MSFKFKLESVLSHAKRKEDRIQQEFSLITFRYKDALNDLEELELRFCEENNCQELNLSLFFVKEAYIDRLKNEIDIQTKVVVKLDQEKAECQRRVLEAVKERKILEKLKEKHKYEFLAQVALAEQKALDEQALNAFQRS